MKLPDSDSLHRNYVEHCTLTKLQAHLIHNTFTLPTWISIQKVQGSIPTTKRRMYVT